MDGMNEIVERLRTANRAIEAQLATAARASAKGTREQGWHALSRASAIVREFGPVLGGIDPRSGGRVQSEVQRYAANLIRLQRRCENVLAELQERRHRVWQEEQNIRNLKAGRNAFRAWD